MARVQVKSLGWGTVWDQAGNVQPDVEVSIIEQGGSEASLYAASTGVATVDSVTDSNGQVPGFLDEGVYTVTNPSFGTFSADVVSGLGTTAAIALLRDAPINVMDETYGAVGDDVADDSAAIQAALDAAEAAGGGTVFFPPGTYRCLTALTFATDVPVSITGSGAPGRGVTSGGTIIHFPTDLGAGTYAMSSSTPASGRRGVFRDFKLLGNGSYTDASGTGPCDMDGLRVNRSQTLHNVTVCKFNACFVIWGDHTSMTDCYASDAKYGVYMPTDAEAQSDQYFRSLNVDSVFAGIALGGGRTWDGCVFEGTHLANLSIGIYREAFTLNKFMESTVWNGLDIEGWGNALIFDESWATSATSTDYINNTTFEGLRELDSFNSTYKYAGKSSAAAFNVWGLIGCTFIGSYPDALGSTCSMSVHEMTGCDFGETATVMAAAQSASKPIWIVASSALFLGCYCTNRPNGGGDTQNRCVLMKATAAVTQYDLLQADGSGGEPKAKKYVSGVPVGVAQHKLAGAGIVPVAFEGRSSINSGASVITALDLVKPDTGNNGQVKTVAASTDLPKVGYACAGNGGGFTTCELHLTL